MLCCRVQNLLSAYCDSELAGAEMLQIRRHLSQCSACEREHEQVLKMKRLMGALSDVAPRRPFRLEELETRARVAPPQPRWVRILSGWARQAQGDVRRRQAATPFLALATGVALSGMVVGVLGYPQRPDAVAAHVPAALSVDDEQGGRAASLQQERVLLGVSASLITPNLTPTRPGELVTYRYYGTRALPYYTPSAPDQPVLAPASYEKGLSESPQLVNKFSRFTGN